MDTKKYLNSILRLRLFFSTEKEFSTLVGYNLKGNHFNRFSKFVCDAYFSKFSDECRDYTQGKIDLAVLLKQYEKTSIFYSQYIEGKNHSQKKTFILPLLDFLFLNLIPQLENFSHKDCFLCQKYADNNLHDELNIGILLLLTFKLIPKYTNKSSQDIDNIIYDFEVTYKFLYELYQSNKNEYTTLYKELLCLKEMRQLINEELAGDKYLNRLLLIHITNDVIKQIYTLKNPIRLREAFLDYHTIEMDLPVVWINNDGSDNEFWTFEPLDNMGYYLIHYKINYIKKEVYFCKYQVIFKYIGYSDFCQTIIMRPSFLYNNILKREQDDNAIAYDYTVLKFDSNNNTLKEIEFTLESPLGEGRLILKPTNEQLKDYYLSYIFSNKQKYKLINEFKNYELSIYTLNIATSANAIIIEFDNKLYKLDIFDNNGRETIEGIRTLTHKDNIVYIELLDKDKKRGFLCFDSINKNIDVDDLFSTPYFHKIDALTDVF